RPSSAVVLPLPVTVEFFKEKVVTLLPLMPSWPEFVTERFVRVAPVTVCRLRLATQLRLLLAEKSLLHPAEPPVTVSDVPLPVRFMFFSVMLLAVVNFRPLCVQAWIVPPVPAVVAVPLTVKE